MYDQNISKNIIEKFKTGMTSHEESLKTSIHSNSEKSIKTNEKI